MRRRRVRLYRKIQDEERKKDSQSSISSSAKKRPTQLNTNWQAMLHDKRIPLAQRQILARDVNKVAGNQALQRSYDQSYGTSMSQERRAGTPGTASNFRSFYPMTLSFNSESVVVHDKWEEINIVRMMRELKEVYGIELNSFKSKAVIQTSYKDHASAEVVDQVKAATWEFKEIHALYHAAKHFAPILGANRINSTRKGTPQEVLFAGKVNAAIKNNQLSNSVMGQFYDKYDTLNLTQAGTDMRNDFEFNTQELEGTAIHELAHGLMDYALQDYITEIGYWSDVQTLSGEEGAEQPITHYSNTNAKEDFAEAMMFFFMKPDVLASKCPKRFRFIMIRMLEWTDTGKQVIELGKFMQANMSAVIRVMQQVASAVD